MKLLSYLRGDGRIWIGLVLAAIILYLVAPAALTPFRLALLGKYLCWAMVAVGIGLAWGKGAVPFWWEPFRSSLITLLAVLLLPAAVAAVLGLAIFRRRVKGAYFAI